MSDQDDHKVITDKLDEILKIMNGNGEIGMCAKVQLMWGRMNKVIASLVGVILFIVTRMIWEFMNKV